MASYVNKLNEETGGHYTAAQLKEALAKDANAGTSYGSVGTDTGKSLLESRYGSNVANAANTGNTSAVASAVQSRNQKTAQSTGKTLLESRYGTDVANAVKTGDTSAVAAAVQRRNGGTGSYTDITGSLTGNTLPAGFTGSSNGIYTYTSPQAALQQLMNRNSELWHLTDDPEEKARLHKENEGYAKMLEDITGHITFDPKTGYWTGIADYTNPKPEFDGTTPYGDMVQDQLKTVQNRDAFSYDAESDPLYQMYYNQYAKGGQRAMQDVLGQMAARTGGLASSYAEAVAQQTYDDYIGQAAGKIPELYKLAYDMYLGDRNYDLDMLNTLNNLDNTAYNRLWDQYTDATDKWYKDRDFNYNRYIDDRTQANYEDEQKYNRWRDAEQWNRDDKANQQEQENWQASFDRQGQWHDEELAREDKANLAEAAREGKNNLYDMVNRYGYIPTQEDAVRYGLTQSELASLQNQARHVRASDASRYYSGW